MKECNKYNINIKIKECAQDRTRSARNVAARGEER